MMHIYMTAPTLIVLMLLLLLLLCGVVAAIAAAAREAINGLVLPSSDAALHLVAIHIGSRALQHRKDAGHDGINI